MIPKRGGRIEFCKSEFANHEAIAKELNTKIYFENPYALWQKGIAEKKQIGSKRYIEREKVKIDDE